MLYQGMKSAIDSPATTASLNAGFGSATQQPAQQPGQGGNALTEFTKRRNWPAKVVEEHLPQALSLVTVREDESDLGRRLTVGGLEASDTDKLDSPDGLAFGDQSHKGRLFCFEIRYASPGLKSRLNGAPCASNP